MSGSMALFAFRSPILWRQSPFEILFDLSGQAWGVRLHLEPTLGYGSDVDDD